MQTHLDLSEFFTYLDFDLSINLMNQDNEWLKSWDIATKHTSNNTKDFKHILHMVGANLNGEHVLDSTSNSQVHNYEKKLSSTILYQYEQTKPKHV
jgi:phage terminase large subunit-like protein